MTLKITSKIVLICTSLVVGTSVILGGFSLYRESQLLTETIVSKKRNEIELVTTYIQARIDELKNDVKLLSLTPPIQGFIRAEENNGFDPIDKSTSKQWRDRLATIFESLQRTKDHYVQIRLIGVQNNGKELVRVDQADSEIRRVFEGELQSKGNEGYFKKITSMTKEDFFFSKFSANKERGKVVVPVHMVLRVAMPIFNSRKTPFGFVVINVDYEEIFSRLKSLITKESEYFITNKGKEVVYHSHPMYNTKQSIHTFQMVEDEVPDLKNIFSSDKNLVLKGYHVGADKVIVANKIYFSLGNTLDFLHIFLTTDRSVVNQKVNGRVKDDLAIILSLVLFAVLLASYFSEFISNPIKVLTSYAENIGKENSKEILESSIHTNDEIGVLANTLAKMSDEIDAKNIMLVNQKDALDHSAIVDETDENGVITYVNDKLLEISKYSRKELLGQDHRILLSDVHSEDFFRNIQETVSSGQVWHGEVCNRAKDGSLFWVALSFREHVASKSI